MSQYTVTYSQRGIDALIMRLSGEPASAIGKRFGITRQRAYQLTEGALRRLWRRPHERDLIPKKLRPALDELLFKYQ